MPEVIEPGIPLGEGCPIFNRANVFVVPQASAPTLEYTFYDGQGRPINLSAYLDACSQSASESASQCPETTVSVRIAESIETPVGCNTPIKAAGYITDPERGKVRVDLPAEVTEYSGVYDIHFAVMEHGRPSVTQRGYIYVERSLFASEDALRVYTGMPTLKELRMALLDVDARDNSLLRSVEFKDDQLIWAIIGAISQFREHPPHTIGLFNSRNFPWPEGLTNGIIAQLYYAAANNYMRNYIPINAGGVSIDDKAKAPDYLKTGLTYDQEWKTFIACKKVEINAGRFVGMLSSPYSRL